MINLGSIYSASLSSSSGGGLRILVTRYWPRGVKKESIDLWLKGLGTEKGLIAEWKAGGLDWDDFSRRYLSGLESDEAKSALAILRDAIKGAGEEPVTLLCTCKEGEQCHRELLKRVLEG
ncbi:MAG: DUF488 family protein [Proteobacteria bacterium]|nr:DUF488 family protein [Pseudomonadota bacterium]